MVTGESSAASGEEGRRPDTPGEPRRKKSVGRRDRGNCKSQRPEGTDEKGPPPLLTGHDSQRTGGGADPTMYEDGDQAVGEGARDGGGPGSWVASSHAPAAPSTTKCFALDGPERVLESLSLDEGVVLGVEPRRRHRALDTAAGAPLLGSADAG